jgi:hypothetical protein
MFTVATVITNVSASTARLTARDETVSPLSCR